jgi:hypothetical protein
VASATINRRLSREPPLSIPVWIPGAGKLAGVMLLAVSSPQGRQAKLQALTRWNDAQGRTSDEVLVILDRAIGRVIQKLAARSAPRVPAGTQW